MGIGVDGLGARPCCDCDRVRAMSVYLSVSGSLHLHILTWGDLSRPRLLRCGSRAPHEPLTKFACDGLVWLHTHQGLGSADEPLICSRRRAVLAGVPLLWLSRLDHHRVHVPHRPPLLSGPHRQGLSSAVVGARARRARLRRLFYGRRGQGRRIQGWLLDWRRAGRGRAWGRGRAGCRGRIGGWGWAGCRGRSWGWPATGGRRRFGWRGWRRRRRRQQRRRWR